MNTTKLELISVVGTFLADNRELIGKALAESGNFLVGDSTDALEENLFFLYITRDTSTIRHPSLEK
jgi:hypothetical protein